MSCFVCSSAHSRQPFLCPTCARNQLYPLRLENAKIILEKERLGREIEASVSIESAPPTSSVPEQAHLRQTEKSPAWTLQTVSGLQASSSARKDDLRRQIEVLKQEIKTKRRDISERRAVLSRRRSDAESAQYELAEREASVLTGLQNTIKRTEHLWHTLHSKTAEARIYLCREAAHLYGLRQRTSRKSDGQHNYMLGGLGVIDLKDMNGANPAQLSTSLSNLARLLVLVSHYLSLRLPAEITLPHRNHPTTTIYTLAASYSSRNLSEGFANANLASYSPAGSRTEPRTHSRPRPLFIDTPLPRLAKEDPGAYALLLEGVSLLAWDAAWLCRTQGINLNSDSWEDICNIGKGMWQLLVAPPAQASTLMRAFAGRDTQKMKPNKDSPQTTIQRHKSFPMLGHYSHGTAHSFLAASEGVDFMRTWKLPTPTKIADKLKATLLGEMASAEWEMLDEKEWFEGPVDDNKQKQLDPQDSTSHPSTSTATTSESDAVNPPGSTPTTEEPRRPKGTSGWTKLNNR
ncbi:Uncharacterized protein PECH_002208 [Penicillium ucsense]|uniref:Autophagy-related protein 14 n=1 Tax=Penicillium ucsense TaxID=2839758 RepID=A0A8J8VZA9_9EURO|nr:Uncharacterized protein PECM_001377 [Penicillium ucsense]KAF7731128.1 Uncharacterized protein PECH_002208 [Penicillium ucsense]